MALESGPVGLHSSGTLALETILNSVLTHMKVSKSTSQGDSANHTWTREKSKEINLLSFYEFLPAGQGQQT